MTRSPQRNEPCVMIPIGARVSFVIQNEDHLSLRVTGVVAYILCGTERESGSYGIVSHLIECDKPVPFKTHPNSHGMPGPSFDSPRGWWIDQTELTLVLDPIPKDMATYYDAITEDTP
jgi:hypothetical protein